MKIQIAIVLALLSDMSVASIISRTTNRNLIAAMIQEATPCLIEGQQCDNPIVQYIKDILEHGILVGCTFKGCPPELHQDDLNKIIDIIKEYATDAWFKILRKYGGTTEAPYYEINPNYDPVQEAVDYY